MSRWSAIGYFRPALEGSRPPGYVLSTIGSRAPDAFFLAQEIDRRAGHRTLDLESGK